MTPYKLAASSMLVLALLAGVALYGHRQYNKGVQLTTLKYETAIAKQKADAAEELATVTTQVAAKEHFLQVAKDNQDIKDAQHTKIVGNLSGKLRDALDASSRLCNAAGCGCSGSSANNAANGNANVSANNAAGCDRVFSTGVADLLEQLTLKADVINNAYTACRADAIQIRSIAQ